MTETKWEYWAPQWAPHIEARYDEREYRPDGIPEEQHIEMRCRVCGSEWKTRCSTGAVRSHIQKFAFIHTHNDPLERKNNGQDDGRQ